MKPKERNKIILIILVLILVVVNYSFFDESLEKFLENSETGIVQRVIDGDTVEINNESVRLLGINCPEKGEYLYEEAKEFLEEKILRQEVEMYFGKDKYDKYHRKLAYLYFENKNVNLEIVEKGFANFYFPSGKDAYYPKFYSAWEKCLQYEKNLCEKSNSKCFNCISLEELNIGEQVVVLKNNCDFDCDLTNWEIKDEGRKKFVFENLILKSEESVNISAEDFEEEYVWTKSGDSLFLRDSETKLVLWKSY